LIKTKFYEEGTMEIEFKNGSKITLSDDYKPENVIRGQSYKRYFPDITKEECPTCELINTGGMFNDAECMKHPKK
jgi:hypothetical protein